MLENFLKFLFSINNVCKYEEFFFVHMSVEAYGREGALKVLLDMSAKNVSTFFL